MAHPGLDALAESSQYALQQLHQQQQHQQATNGVIPRPQLKGRQSFGGASMTPVGGTGNGGDRRDSTGGTKDARANSNTNTNGQGVRRRISRACDQCNQLRTKCDGKSPCQHCIEFGLTCEYARERKKRGKASRKDLAAQQMHPTSHGEVKESSPGSGNEGESDQAADESKQIQQGIKRRRSSVTELPPPQLPPPRTCSMSGQRMSNGNGVLPSMEQNSGMNGDPNALERQQSRTLMEQQTPGMTLPTPRLTSVELHDRGVPVAMGEYGTMDDYHRSILHPGGTMSGHNILHSGVSAMPNTMIHGGTITGYGESPYGVPSPNSRSGAQNAPFQMGESPLSAGFLGQSPGALAGSPGWLSLPSPSGGLGYPLQQIPTNQVLRYPVLRPLVPHISTIIPIPLACDLLELYFTSTSSAFMSPQSPYILGYIFRKRSFLRVNNPRPCSPALLASMLWIAAQTSESVFLTSPPSARGKICQKLHELTVSLLKPLIHAPTDGTVNYGNNAVINGVALGGFGVGMPGQSHEMESGSPGATGALDDVATYIHLATVVSASEYKAASLRWWNAAWSLARELKLGREMPPLPEPAEENQNGETQLGSNSETLSGVPSGPSQPQGNQAIAMQEEEREERRRIWWLLYIVDRHLALCYNRPLFLLDIECDGLFQPENDVVWQANDFYTGDPNPEAAYYRRRGPCFECTGHGIFGYFLPLMTILGEIVDLNHARNHPRFGLRFRGAADWDGPAQEISTQLEAYGRSLKDFEARNSAPPPGQGPQETHQIELPALNGGGENGHHDAMSPSGHSVNTNTSSQRITELQLQTKIVVAYSTHLMHTLHILVNGKWDPISLLDDNDLWISSQSFISATGHAVSAAEAINEILDYDPDLSFMPFFFGIYLLQGSFLLLLIADKLQAEASPNVVKACETIVRAHEACVVTLNTEYQVSRAARA